MSEPNIKEYLNSRLLDVEKCYQNLTEPYYDKSIGMINSTHMSTREREEFIVKRNCLLVQKEVYKEILEFIGGDKNE